MMNREIETATAFRNPVDIAKAVIISPKFTNLFAESSYVEFCILRDGCGSVFR